MPWIGSIRIDKIHTGTLQQPWIDHRREEGAVIGTINHGLKVVRRILNLASTKWVDEYGMMWLLSAPGHLKTELIGNFTNTGARYLCQAVEVNTKDVLSEAKGKAIPYGIFNEINNSAMVVVGTSIETPQFAVLSIRHW